LALVLTTNDEGGPEIFASIQGEGPSMGAPVAFIRLSRCNLACQWCDTAYSWRFTGDNRAHRDMVHYPRKANQVTLDEEEAARRIAALGQSRLVITGGEPLLQSAGLARMLEFLPDHAVEIETNGTIKPAPRLDVRVDQYNVSPKLSHSGNEARLALIDERLDAFASDPRAFFKFVVASPRDVDEVEAILRRFHIDRARVYLMAEGTTSEGLRERQRWLAPLCVERGLKMSDRLHIHLFGDTRAT